MTAITTRCSTTDTNKMRAGVIRHAASRYSPDNPPTASQLACISGASKSQAKRRMRAWREGLLDWERLFKPPMRGAAHAKPPSNPVAEAPLPQEKSKTKKPANKPRPFRMCCLPWISFIPTKKELAGRMGICEWAAMNRLGRFRDGKITGEQLYAEPDPDGFERLGDRPRNERLGTIKGPTAVERRVFGE